jgi:CRISPR-associated protein Csd1
VLLQRLRDFSERLDLPPSMYALTPIRWLIQLDGNGQFRGFVQTTGSGRGKDRGKEYFAPHITRASGVRAKLLADNAEYVLGLARKANKLGRVAKCHANFVELVGDCARETGAPGVFAVERFLAELDPIALDLPQDFDAGDGLTFAVEGELPIHDERVQRYWAAVTAGAGLQREAARGATVGECLVCGERKPVERRMPFPLKGIPGGQKSGTALISANEDAFESYGLKASRVAPTCRECAERFMKSANWLLRDEGSHLVVGPLVFLFWTRSQSPFSVVELLSRPSSDQVRELISAAWTAREGATRFDAEPFYAVALSASGGRAVVRDWMETTVPAVQRNLARFFALQRIVDPESPESPKPYGVYTLARSTVRDATPGARRPRSEPPAEVLAVLLSFALRGGRLPWGLLAQAIRRNRAGRNRAGQLVTRPRASLIKMVLLSQAAGPYKEEEMVQTDTQNRDPAYLCGRMLAVLEKIQRKAIPSARATLIDRFFGTASSAPASVFGTLLRMTQPHLAKLRKEKPRTFEALQKRIQDIVYPDLQSFPKTLTLQQQGLFSLGYYHERAEDRAAGIAGRLAKERAGEAEEEDEDEDEDERQTE